MAPPVEQIKERLSILDVVGAYVELHKAGKHYKGKSPFVNEKTPSFFVSPDRGMYFCFSSQKGGDMFTFIEEMEGVDFKGALKLLADKAGVELVPEDPKKRDARETQYALLEEATQFFFKTREEFPNVEAYIADRGVTGTTVHTWRIGYAKDEWRALKIHLTGKGYTEAQMLAAGLIKKTDPNKESYDVFRDRIMFPIMDPTGRVVAFSGRTLKKDDGIPKYVNSPETELYQKSEILYGYDKAKQGIRHYDFSLIVEGQFDLVLSHQAGYANAVAVSGTAFTPHHLALLERLSSRIVLALDSDRAGIAAVKRISGVMLAHGMDIKVARMEGGKDPADIIKVNPLDFKHFIGAAVHVIEFLLAVLKENTKDERTYKLRVREEIIPLLASMPNRIDREHFEQIVATATETTKDAIHFEVERIIELTLSHAKVPEKVSPATSPAVPPKVTAASRIHAIKTYLVAIVEACVDARAPLGARIKEELDRFMQNDLLKIDDAAIAESGALFSAERYLESVSDRVLREDVSHQLTTLMHLVAREILSVARTEIVEAERVGDEDRLTHALSATKEAQNMLAAKIEITA